MQPFRGPFVIVTPPGLRPCQLRLKHGSGPREFEETSSDICARELMSLRSHKSNVNDASMHQSILQEDINAARMKMPASSAELTAASVFLFLPRPASARAHSQLPFVAQPLDAVLKAPCIFYSRNDVTDPFPY